MKTSESLKEIFTAISLAQGEFRPAKKDATNPFFKSKYADFEDVVNAVRPSLLKYGLSFIQMPTVDNAAFFLVTRICHKSGEWIEAAYPIKTAKEDAQALGSAVTYARRYALQSALGVVTSEHDDDGNSASGKGDSVDYSVASKDVVIKLIKSFEALYVSKAQLENYVQQSSDAFTMDAVEALRQIWSEIKTGKAKKSDYFGT